jgi:hypothetical protein
VNASTSWSHASSVGSSTNCAVIIGPARSAGPWGAGENRVAPDEPLLVVSVTTETPPWLAKNTMSATGVTLCSVSSAMAACVPCSVYAGYATGESVRSVCPSITSMPPSMTQPRSVFPSPSKSARAGEAICAGTTSVLASPMLWSGLGP